MMDSLGGVLTIVVIVILLGGPLLLLLIRREGTIAVKKKLKKKSASMETSAVLRKGMTGLGCLLYPIGVSGALLIHFLAAYIAYRRYGTLGAIVAFIFPIFSTLWAIWVTISSTTADFFVDKQNDIMYHSM
jgi:hypothetical protein